MSKSKKNVVDPDDIIAQYGADTARIFMLSDSPPERDVIWAEEGVMGAFRFVQTLWRQINEIASFTGSEQREAPAFFGPAALDLRKAAHGAALRIEDQFERLRFNTAVAEIRKLSNALGGVLDSVEDAAAAGPDLRYALREAAGILTLAIAPVAPHLAEEAWAALGSAGLAAEQAWPAADPELATRDELRLPVQVNGRKRGEIVVPRDAEEDVIRRDALALDAVQKALEGRAPKRVVVVPQRIVNVVV
jgi:leucyl-tRNA synthetase